MTGDPLPATYLLIDIDALTQEQYDRLADDPLVFLHAGHFHVPVMFPGWMARDRLVADGWPATAIEVSK